MVLCCSRGAKHVGEDVWSDLGNAAYTGNLPRMIQQLSNGGDVTAADANGFTPIHRAAQSGNFEAVQLLLKCGADARCSATNGETPLHIAAFHRNAKTVKLLLETDAKADVNKQNTDHGMTPLHVAVYRGCPEIVDLLLAAGANPDITAKGQTTLNLAEFGNSQELQGRSSPSAKHHDTLLLLQNRLKS
ncbi:ankyrin, putative [Toxoplasma gondii ME49]|uniref:Ankyrin, putative n=1 Tax=Toxoplasma gondii (strain ATCC 50611 / Me49) TaxID=508771 RepID=S8F7Q6_TOXGM|nr:ankyrin, putative [Toxoplasma gondii ME49]EPT29583.1 ankyrin, putative [Toxoplasma gondii ME49]|eukprot:XP_002365291.1 ankyrin, putative [Toxoplasma gondii ME49]